MGNKAMLTKEYFDNVPDRRGSGCYKWDIGDPEDVLQMWVADMDYPLAPKIRQALQRRLDHGVFGYTKIKDEAYEAVVRWYADNYGWAFPKETLLFTSGVVPAISAIIKATTKPGDSVLILTPVYNCFFSSIRNNECKVVECPLRYTGETYVVDYEAMERAIVANDVKVFLLCNPHNPAGRVWTPEELKTMGDICLKHNVLVLADEVHNGIIMPGNSYTPYGKLGDKYMANSVVTSSPSKSFNFAGLQISYIVCQDTARLNAIDKALNINEVCDVNPLGVEALISAYAEVGFEWLDAVNGYIHENYEYLCDFVRKELPSLRVVKLEGTYLAWLDISALKQSSKVIANRLVREAKVRFTAGDVYGAAGEGFIRINLACSNATLREALRRAKTVLG